MSVNRSEQTLPNKLTTEIANLRRELNALKTRQLDGGDNLTYQWSTGSIATSTLLDNQALNVINSLNNTVSDLELFPIPLINVYVGSVVDPAFAWPYGGSLTTAQVNDIRVSWFIDRARTGDNAKIWGLTVQVLNKTGSPLDVLVRTRWRFPKVSI